ncbi:MAG: Crp/Fnr family transcriptional regulator [Hyphomicrobiaceae bacterium]|nr:Crp/Fnr family transcriptional regulator [Hyphomicrobiaceae bacterium]
MYHDRHVAILKKLPIFGGMDHEDLSMLVFSSERLAFQRGERLMNDGQLGHAAYVVLSGSAEIIEGSGDQRRIHMVGPGAMVGELAMLVEFTFSSTCIASEEMEVLELRRELIHRMMQQFPPIAEHFSMRIHGRLSKMVEQLRRFDRPSGASAKSHR